MIVIKVDKESELVWIQNVISSGVQNVSNPYKMNFLGVPLQQEITYVADDNYEDDIKDKREEYNSRFADKGLRPIDVENILRKEYRENKPNTEVEIKHDEN